MSAFHALVMAGVQRGGRNDFVCMREPVYAFKSDRSVNITSGSMFMKAGPGGDITFLFDE